MRTVTPESCRPPRDLNTSLVLDPTTPRRPPLPKGPSKRKQQIIAHRDGPLDAAQREEFSRRHSAIRGMALNYAKPTRFVQQTQGLDRSPTPDVIAAGLDKALVRLYLNKHRINDAHLTFYGVRRSHRLTNALRHLSYHSPPGYMKQLGTVNRRPALREPVTPRTLALLTPVGPEAALAERFLGAAASLLSRNR